MSNSFVYPLEPAVAVDDVVRRVEGDMRRADPLSRVVLTQTDVFPRDATDIGSSQDLVAETGKVAVSEVVGDNENDIWPTGPGRSHGFDPSYAYALEVRLFLGVVSHVEEHLHAALLGVEGELPVRVANDHDCAELAEHALPAVRPVYSSMPAASRKVAYRSIRLTSFLRIVAGDTVFPNHLTYLLVCTIFPIVVETRKQILQELYDDARKKGLVRTRTDEVVKRMGITKGAFYHYFPDKQSAGLAMIHEVLAPLYLTGFDTALLREGSTSAGSEGQRSVPDLLEERVRSVVVSNSGANLPYGCPLGNLAYELSATDPIYRDALASIHRRIIAQLEEYIRAAQKQQAFAPDLDPVQAATFVWTSMQGIFAVGKATVDQTLVDTALENLLDVIRGWRIA